MRTSLYKCSLSAHLDITSGFHSRYMFIILYSIMQPLQNIAVEMGLRKDEC